jgi:hypothetical protein
VHRIVLITVLLLPVRLLAQLTGDTDTLKKYSYKLQGFSTGQYNGLTMVRRWSGTVFFIRSVNQLYLVTAKHVLSGCDNSDSVKLKNFPDEMLVEVSRDKHFNKLLKINSAIIRDTSACLSTKLYPDVIAVKIDDTIADQVYSIEGLIHPLYKRVTNSLVIGYPGYANRPIGDLSYFDPHAIALLDGRYFLSAGYVDTTRTTLDKIHFWIYPKDIDTGDSLGGYSGSPFYVQDQRSKKWRIAGVFASSGADSGKLPVMYAVKIDYVLDEINRHQRSSQ